MIKPQFTFIPFISFVCITLISIHIMNILLGMQLNQFGIFPRHIDGLVGIFTHPFLHANWQHLLQNLISFSILVGLAWPLKATRIPWIIAITTLGEGVLVWLFARESFHIGLSGVVYGLWAYILVFAVSIRSIKALLIAIVVMFLYASFIWGLLPVIPGMSFETHLFGALIGGGLARYFAKKDKQARLKNDLRYQTEQALKGKR